MKEAAEVIAEWAVHEDEHVSVVRQDYADGGIEYGVHLSGKSRLSDLLMAIQLIPAADLVTLIDTVHDDGYHGLFFSVSVPL